MRRLVAVAGAGAARLRRRRRVLPEPHLRQVPGEAHGKLLGTLDDIVAMGDPRAKGKHLPRKAKKALKKQAALAKRRRAAPARGAGRRGAAAARGAGRTSRRSTLISRRRSRASDRPPRAGARVSRGCSARTRTCAPPSAAGRRAVGQRGGAVPGASARLGKDARRRRVLGGGRGGDLFMRPDEAVMEGHEAMAIARRAARGVPFEWGRLRRRGPEPSGGGLRPPSAPMGRLARSRATTRRRRWAQAARELRVLRALGGSRARPARSGWWMAALRQGSTFHQLVGRRLRALRRRELGASVGRRFFTRLRIIPAGFYRRSLVGSHPRGLFSFRKNPPHPESPRAHALRARRMARGENSVLAARPSMGPWFSQSFALTPSGLMRPAPSTPCSPPG